MSKKEYGSFAFLKKIYFVRTGGSPEELKAAELIAGEVARLGGKASLESFEVDCTTIEKAELSFTEPEMKIECAGSGWSGSTPKRGVTGEFVYIGGKEELDTGRFYKANRTTGVLAL